MPGADANLGTNAAPTNIPPGTYRGETTMTFGAFLDGQMVETQTTTIDAPIIIDNDGRPINTRTGKAVSVGDVSSFSFADTNITGTTTSVISSGNTIVEHYDVLWVEGDLAATGEGIDTYIYTGSGIDVEFHFSVGMRLDSNTVASISYQATGTLTR
jgi:hypothetical protein